MQQKRIDDGARAWFLHDTTLRVVEVTGSQAYGEPESKTLFCLYTVRTDFKVFESVHRSELFLLLEERELLVLQLRRQMRQLMDYLSIVAMYDDEEVLKLPLDTVED